MKIKRKNHLSYLFASIALGIFMILDFIYYDIFDYHTQFGIWLLFINVLFFGLYCIRYYIYTLEKSHIIDIENDVLVYDKANYIIDDTIKFKLKYSSLDIWVSLYIGKKLIFKNITFSADEFDRFLHIIKPYLKNPDITQNINFHELKLLEDSFFIGRKKFYYKDIEKLEVSQYINHYSVKVFELQITMKNTKFYKKTVLQKKNQSKVEMIVKTFMLYQ